MTNKLYSLHIILQIAAFTGKLECSKWQIWALILTKGLLLNNAFHEKQN